MKFKSLILIILTLSTLSVKAQDPNERGNLTHYYNQILHFGFHLGVNRATFIIDPIHHFERLDSLKKVEPQAKMGFNLGILADLRLQKYLTLRFLPNLSFVERRINYTFEGYDTIVRPRTIASTFMNFPLNFKLRSKRVHNFGAYLLAGGSYSIDLASQKDTESTENPNISEQIVKLNNTDIYYEVGTGFEFYLEYFKFGIEFKLSMGTKDLLIKENTILSNSINKLNSKVFLVSITFEG